MSVCHFYGLMKNSDYKKLLHTVNLVISIIVFYCKFGLYYSHIQWVSGYTVALSLVYANNGYNNVISLLMDDHIDFNLGFLSLSDYQVSPYCGLRLSSVNS